MDICQGDEMVPETVSRRAGTPMRGYVANFLLFLPPTATC
jgi:hypothetical protein